MQEISQMPLPENAELENQSIPEAEMPMTDQVADEVLL